MRAFTLIGSLVLASLVLALLGSVAEAQTRPPVDRQAAEAACGGDAQRLCGPMIPDEAKIAQCLRDNRDNLTPACKAIIR